MALREIQNRSLSDQVFEQLAGEIMSMRYAPGEALPAERALAATLGVNRHVVREAIRRLEQIGLVRVAQGGSTRVLAYQAHAGLDLLALLSKHAQTGAESARFWLAILELRVAIGGEMAHQCARRADAALRKELLALSEEMRAAQSDEKLYALEVKFWERVLDGADNVVCRLALNSMLKASAAIGVTAHHWSAREARQADFRKPIAQAIARGDATAAEDLTRESLRSVVRQFEASLEGANRPAKGPSTRRKAAPVMAQLKPAAAVGRRKSAARRKPAAVTRPKQR